MQRHTSPAELLAAASPVLAKWCPHWYVFGAQASILWGRPRSTTDVDITVQLQPDESADFCADMEAAGFSLRVSDAGEFIAKTRVLPFHHRASGWPLDVVLAGPGLEELFLRRATIEEIGGVAVPVATPEDIIIMKILAGRAKDIGDVRSILSERAKSLDLDHIRTMLGMLERALDQSDLLPAFEAELSTQPR